jgi:hypothetical protein
MSTTVSSVKNMQTADKSAATGKLALSGQVLSYPTTAGTTVEEVVDTVGLVVGPQGTVATVLKTCYWELGCDT